MLETVNFWLSSVLTPGALLLCGLFFLAYLKGGPLCHPVAMLRAMLRKQPGEGVSPFRALTLALAGTLGVGNIVGVASAIALGGPGAIFWMWISALVAMLLKYAEIVLSQRYRVRDGAGNYHGGAMYYIVSAFSGGRLAWMGRGLAVVFALLCVADALSTGCVIQANAIAGALAGVWHIPVWVCGLLLALLTALIVGRGAEKLSFLTEWLVPLMSGGYLLLSLAVLWVRRAELGAAFGAIFAGVLHTGSIGGGVLGFVSLRAIRYGTMRGLLSNEAGCGTAPIAHASSRSDRPAEQGFFGIFEVFVDTILLCTMTALVILVSPEVIAIFGENGVMMTIGAYAAVLGRPAACFLSVAVLLFGFATVVCWSHYGTECLLYLTGRRGWHFAYQLSVCLAVLVGAIAAPGSVWLAADLTIGLMTLINLYSLLCMRRQVKEETEIYFRRPR